jgi:hypothetical protein
MKKLLLSLLVVSALMLSVIPGVFAAGSGGSIGGSFSVEDFKPIVWQCGERIMTDENVQPWRFSYENDFLYERAGNYLFEGEKFTVDVVVFDKNKVDSATVDLILDSSPGTVESADDAEYSVNCVEAEVDFSKCNAQIGEEELDSEDFDADTMQGYECSITILDSESMYGDYWLTVLAESGLTPGNVGVYDEMTPLWLNPTIILAVDGSLDFEDVRPGTLSYSQVSITNEAEGGVALDMFITGKDWPSVTPGNLGRCQYVDGSGAETNGLVNYLPLGAFRYYAENGAFTTRFDEERDGGDGLSAPFDTVNYDASVNREKDAEGYVNINEQLNAGFEEAMFDDAEIIQAGGPAVEKFGNEYGYRANVLNQGGLMALTFRLDLPEPCYGEFESPTTGSVFIWGEAI